MKLDRLALSVAVVLALGTAAQAAEQKQPAPAETPKALELTQEQLDQVTAGGPFGVLRSNVGSLKPNIQAGAVLFVLFILDQTSGN